MRLGGYLEAARRRLKWLVAARGAALTVTALLVLTAGIAWLVMVLVPPAATVTWLRVLLYLVLAAAVAVLVWWPQTRQRAATTFESRVPAFGGRLSTWHDADRRGDDSELFGLLTRETADIAERNPVPRVVPAGQLLLPLTAAVAGVVMMVTLLAGDHPWQLAAQRLWAGGLLADAQPHIVVTPGDTVVRRGSDVVIDAKAQGFQPGDMRMHASFGAAGWERAPMSRLGDEGHGFVFVGVSEEIEYYVSARGITSGRHRIRVADLPTVTDVALTYRFPEWTGLDASELHAGDVTALPGTRVDVTASTDRPVSDAVLVVNGQALDTAWEGSRVQGGFDVSEPGSWHVAVRHEGDLARISDTYLIELAEDDPPEIAYRFPGHDRKATPIEEVALEFEAEDDYGVESLTLSYAVNGGSWNEVPLTGASGEHLLALERLTVPEGGERPLAPGDVISLYAEARDHTQSSRSALYFVDVRPFDMRYRESQQMSSQGQAEGGGFDIAERQRDILSATWNLINKRDRERGAEAEKAARDQAEVLAMLQRTLREQVQTVLTRSQARGLGRDNDVSDFLRELSAAMEHMEPAAQRLEALELMEAVPREQQALRHLVTAEASVRDVDVSLSRSNNRGTSGQSLGELIELEMDPERNRYEMPQQPGLGEPGGSEESEDWKRLEELAARQERLARQQGQDPDSLPSRWEQARLQRELEEVRREFEQRRNRAGVTSSQSMERALADVSAAQEALEQRPGDPEAQRQASEALRRAAGTLRETSRDNLQERLSRAGRRVSNLEADQARVTEALEELQENALERARSGQGVTRSDYAMQTFGAVKRRMQEDLADLRGELTEVSEALDRRGEDGARMLDRALRELDDARLDERLAAAAEAFEMGQPLYVIGSESLVEQALGRLSRRVQQARDSVTRSADGDTTDPLEEVRALRRRLAEARDGRGELADDEVESVARSLVRLAPDQVPERAPGRAGGAVTADRFGRDDGVYEIRGIASENTETLYDMTLERLDLIEATLESAESMPIRAQNPRDAARDSAAARYFRELSRRTTDDD